MAKLKQIGGWIGYPWLMGLYPVLFLYARNQNKVYAQDFYEVIAATLLAISILVAMSWLLVRHVHKAAAMAAAIVIPFFTYGHIALELSSGKYAGQDWLADALLPGMIVLGVALALLFALAVPGEDLRKATPYLTVVTLGLVLYNGLSVANQALKYQALLKSLRPSISAQNSAPKIQNDAAYPDIYYIILDSYSSNSALMEQSQIDNSAFTDALEQRGFYVAYDSTTPYPLTLPSMASSLNMRYLEPHEGPDGDAGVLYSRILLADNAVAQDLLSRGYTYVFMMSGYDTSSSIADLNIDFFRNGPRYFPRSGPPPADSYRSSFWPLLLDSTMLADLDIEDDLPSGKSSRPEGWTSARRVPQTLDEVPKIARMPEATFTIAHIMLPHLPIRFTRDGKVHVYKITVNTGPRRVKAYTDQLEWLNERTLQMVDEIVSQSSTPPVIIIQGDHGSLLGGQVTASHVGVDPRFFKILNAYYFPGPNGQAQLTPDIMSVNSFRVLLNTYFEEDYSLLDSYHYKVSDQYEDIFGFQEVPAPFE